MTKSLLFLFCILLWEPISFAQKATVHSVPSTFSIGKDETKLADLINRYRSKKGFGELQLSPSLCFVAKTHLLDVARNRPDKSGYSLYSWSDKGSWKPCLFKDNIVNLDQMSAKPFEVVGFRGKGFEIMIASIENKSMVELLDLWLKKKTTGDFLLSTGKWDNKSWQSMGVCVYKGYASIWLSEIPDRVSALQAKKDLKNINASDDARGDSRNNSSTTLSEKSSKQTNGLRTSRADSIKRSRDLKNNKTDVIHKDDESISSNKVKTESSNFKNYYLVHSTYSDLKEAIKMMEFLKKTGIKRLILLDSKGEYRVVLGVYPEKELAEAAIAKLKSRFSNLTVFSF